MQKYLIVTSDVIESKSEVIENDEENVNEW
jgi:hypothetical protein